MGERRVELVVDPMLLLMLYPMKLLPFLLSELDALSGWFFLFIGIKAILSRTKRHLFVLS